MAVLVERGVLALNTGGATQDINLSNFGGTTPVAIKAFATKVTAPGVTLNNHLTYGFSDGTTHKCIFGQDQDNVSTTDSRRGWDNYLLKQISTAGAVEYEISVSSFSADKVTLSLDTLPSSNYKIHYIVYGGDITNAKVVQMGNFLDQANGAYNVTGAGFTPDYVEFISSNDASAAGSINSNMTPSIGMAISSSKRASMSVYSEDGVTTPDSGNRLETDKCLIAMNSTGAVRGEMDFNSFNSDGCNIQLTNNWSNNSRLQVLFLGGGKWDLGTFTTETSLTTKKVTMGIRPKAFWHFSRLEAVTGSPENDLEMSLGCAVRGNGESTVSALSQNQSSPGTALTASTSNETHFYEKIDEDSHAVDGLANISSWENDGFIFEQINADSPAREIAFASVGDDIPSQNNLRGNLRDNLLGGLQ